MQQNQFSPISEMGQMGALYTLIRQHDGITHQQLARSLAIPSTTLNRNLKRLIKTGLIDDSGLADSSGGRRANLYTITNQPCYFLGLDLSGARGKIVLADLKLAVIGSQSCAGLSELLKQDNPADQITDLCSSLLAELAVSSDRIHGIGIGLASPGQIGVEDSEKADPEQASVFFKQLCLVLAETFHCQIRTLRGADAALYAGLWLDRKLSGSTMLYFSAGQAMRAGMVMHGQFHQSDLATDIINDLLVPYGSKHALTELSKISTRSALLRQFQSAKQASTLNWQDFRKACKQGKRKSLQVLDKTARASAIVIWNAVTLADARYLLLGGSVIYDIPQYRTILIEQLHKMLKTYNRQLAILDNPYGENIVAVGAAARVLELMISEKP